MLKIRSHWLLDGKKHARNMQARAHPADEQRHDIAYDNLGVRVVTKDVMSPPTLIPGNPSEALAIRTKVNEPIPHDSEA